MLWLRTFQMGLIIYVSLLLLTPKILSLPFAPQDNAFLSWLIPTPHSTIGLIAGSAEHSPPQVEDFPRWVSPRQGKDFLQLCDDI